MHLEFFYLFFGENVTPEYLIYNDNSINRKISA